MNQRILLIEDNQELLDLVSMIISTRKGYEVMQMTDGKKAWELLEKESFDIVITDLVLDSMPGVEIIRRLREKNSEVRIIAVSGKGQHYLDQAVAEGANIAVPKPFTIAQMVAAIEG